MLREKILSDAALGYRLLGRWAILQVSTGARGGREKNSQLVTVGETPRGSLFVHQEKGLYEKNDFGGETSRGANAEKGTGGITVRRIREHLKRVVNKIEREP